MDANHGDITRALRKIGCKVVDASRMGEGFPDLIVWFRGRWMLLEVKDGSKPPSARKLTPDQVKWHREFAGCMVFVVTSEEEAIAAVTHFEG